MKQKGNIKRHADSKTRTQFSTKTISAAFHGLHKDLFLRSAISLEGEILFHDRLLIIQ